MKRIHKALTALCLLIISSCAVVETENYIHEATEEARSSLDDFKFRGDKIELREETECLLIPDFYRFWPGYSARGDLHILTRNNAFIEVVSASISDPSTKEKKERIEYDKSESWEQVGGYRIHSVNLFDLMSESIFLDSETLILEVEWKFENESKVKKESFKLIKKHGKDVAYAT